MRQALLNANADLAAKNPKYVVQITGDNDEGKKELDNFIDPEKPYPVIATASRLMNTGVDAQTCKLIVLDRSINSMTEFKQIIGRGTRINEDYDKLWFSILDFKRATELFADPAFDGEPVVIHEPQPDRPIAPPDDPGIPGEHPVDLMPEGPPGQPRIKYVIGDVPVYVAREQVQYYGADGRLVTESLRDFTRIVISRRFSSLDDFLKTWSAAEKKQAVIAELEAQGVFFDELAAEFGDKRGKELAPFDLILHIAFGQKPLTRRERALAVKKRNVFGKYGDTARKVLDALLDKYADAGIVDIEQGEVLKLAPLDQIGSPVELIQSFGGRPQYLQALAELERSLYPPGYKNYSKTKPMRIEEFSAEKAWWHQRVEGAHAWRVSVADLQARNYNFDLKNPHAIDAISHDPAALLHEMAGLDAEIATLKAQLKAALTGALQGE